jgi:ABC-type nickel/cobalt efflux system permease component RcnA
MPVKAHPQPLVAHEFEINIEDQDLNMLYRLRLDPIVAKDVFGNIDTDNDEKASSDELKTYAIETLFPNLTGRLNNRDLKFEYISSTPKQKNELRSLEDYLEIRFKAIDPNIAKSNSLYFKYDKSYRPDDDYGDFYSFRDNLFDRADITIPDIDQTQSLEINEYSLNFEFKNAQGNPTSNNNPSKGENIFKQAQNLSTSLSNQVKSFDFSNPVLILLSLLILLVAGGLHAITPGHGKSMVAAFLIGKKDSKAGDVFILGLAITLAHTAGIYIIGFALLALNQTSYATEIVTIVEKVSSWLFLGLGLILFYNGYRAYKHHKLHESTEHGHSHTFDKKFTIRNRWDLFYAGISGGIIPCIDALSILFLFISLGQTALGLIFVFVFSIGLAAAIILLGLSLLYGKNKLGLEEKIGAKAEYLLPFISGVIISLIGIFYILSR